VWTRHSHILTAQHHPSMFEMFYQNLLRKFTVVSLFAAFLTTLVHDCYLPGFAFSILLHFRFIQNLL